MSPARQNLAPRARRGGDIRPLTVRPVQITKHLSSIQAYAEVGEGWPLGPQLAALWLAQPTDVTSVDPHRRRLPAPWWRGLRALACGAEAHGICPAPGKGGMWRGLLCLVLLAVPLSTAGQVHKLRPRQRKVRSPKHLHYTSRVCNKEFCTFKRAKTLQMDEWVSAGPRPDWTDPKASLGG
jgi:hypothetical protein